MPFHFGVEALSAGYFFRLISKRAAGPAAPGGWAGADPTHLATLHLFTLPNGEGLRLK